jgi:mRNA interferase RelE/StbE
MTVREPALRRSAQNMAYKVSFTHSAEKDLSKIPKRDVVLLLDACTALEIESEHLNIKKLHPPLHGYRLRVGQYRILYVQEDSVHITVHAIKHRKDAYK